VAKLNYVQKRRPKVKKEEEEAGFGCLNTMRSTHDLIHCFLVSYLQFFFVLLEKPYQLTNNKQNQRLDHKDSSF
jgi:hypothetical protein